MSRRIERMRWASPTPDISGIPASITGASTVPGLARKQPRLNSRTAVKLVREWIDLHVQELNQAWDDAVNFRKINKIPPLT